MSRTTYIVHYTNAPATVNNLKAILSLEKHENILENGEYVWKCGNGS